MKVGVFEVPREVFAGHFLLPCQDAAFFFAALLSAVQGRLQKEGSGAVRPPPPTLLFYLSGIRKQSPPVQARGAEIICRNRFHRRRVCPETRPLSRRLR